MAKKTRTGFICNNSVLAGATRNLLSEELQKIIGGFWSGKVYNNRPDSSGDFIESYSSEKAVDHSTEWKVNFVNQATGWNAGPVRTKKQIGLNSSDFYQSSMTSNYFSGMNGNQISFDVDLSKCIDGFFTTYSINMYSNYWGYSQSNMCLMRFKWDADEYAVLLMGQHGKLVIRNITSGTDLAESGEWFPGRPNTGKWQQVRYGISSSGLVEAYFFNKKVSYQFSDSYSSLSRLIAIPSNPNGGSMISVANLAVNDGTGPNNNSYPKPIIAVPLNHNTESVQQTGLSVPLAGIRGKLVYGSMHWYTIETSDDVNLMRFKFSLDNSLSEPFVFEITDNYTDKDNLKLIHLKFKASTYTTVVELASIINGNNEYVTLETRSGNTQAVPAYPFSIAPDDNEATSLTNNSSIISFGPETESASVEISTKPRKDLIITAANGQNPSHFTEAEQINFYVSKIHTESLSSARLSFSIKDSNSGLELTSAQQELPITPLTLSDSLDLYSNFNIDSLTNGDFTLNFDIERQDFTPINQPLWVYGDDGSNGEGYYYPVYLSSEGLGSTHTHVIQGNTYYIENDNANHAQVDAPSDLSLRIAPNTVVPADFQMAAQDATPPEYQTYVTAWADSASSANRPYVLEVSHSMGVDGWGDPVLLQNIVIIDIRTESSDDVYLASNGAGMSAMSLGYWASVYTWESQGGVGSIPVSEVFQRTGSIITMSREVSSVSAADRNLVVYRQGDVDQEVIVVQDQLSFSLDRKSELI